MLSNRKFKKLLKRYGISIVDSHNTKGFGYILDKEKVKDLLSTKDENNCKKIPNILK